MQLFDGYIKRKINSNYVLLANGSHKSLGDFIGSLQYDSENKKLQYKSCTANSWSDLLTFGDRAFDSTSYLPLSGGNVSNNINLKGTFDLTKSNNNVESTIWPTTFNIMDAGNRISARLENVVLSNGTNGFFLYARLYNSSGTMTALRGLSYNLTKADTPVGTWTVHDPASFRTALGLGARATDNTEYLPKAGGTLEGPLYIKLNSTATNYKLAFNADGEGGNITIYAPDSYKMTKATSTIRYYLIDAYNGNLRIYTETDGSSWASLNTSGSLSTSALGTLWGSSTFNPNNYLAKSGGTLTGNTTCTTSGANLVWGNITIYGGGSNGGINSLLVGDDVTIGDCNLGGIMGMKSTGTNAGFKFFNSSGSSIGGILSTNGTLQWQNASGTFYNVWHSGNIDPLPNNSTWIPSVLTNAGMTRRFGFLYSSACMGWASNNSEMYVYTDGMFYQREGAYYCLDNGNTYVTSGTGVINNNTITLVSNADTVDGYHEGSFFRYRGTIDVNYVDLTTYTANATNYQNPANGIWNVSRSGWSAGLITFTGSGSASGLDIYFHYAKGNEFKFRRRIDSNRLSGAWESFITSENIGSQSVNYATSAGNADTVDSLHAADFVRALGTSNANIDSDWGQSIKTFDPIPSGTPPEQNPNITLLSLGNSFARRKMLAFTYSNDNIYYRRRVDSSFSSWVKILHSGNWSSYCAAASHTHSVSQLTWTGGANLTPTASANNQEWSIDLNPGSYTGCYWHVWSSKLGASILSCYPDDSRVVVRLDCYARNFYTTSDKNKKQNISSFSEHIKKFLLKDSGRYAYGVIAQEVPEMFRDGEEGSYTVNYNSVLSYYIGILENKVRLLEEKINKLEGNG